MSHPTIASVELEHHTILTNGVHLHVVQAGPQDGELVILLHGFPEFWYGWRSQIPALAQAGFRVWAPDQRGYNVSEKPHGVDSYQLDLLARDVLGLIEVSGRDKAFVVGHDWGAAVTWWVAAKYPERLHKIAILNVPHPAVVAHNLTSNPRQMLRSWYIGFFQIPRLPELLLVGGDAQGGINLMLRSSRPGSFTDADIPHYIAAWKQPGAMTAMINWYRAVVRRREGFAVEGDQRIHVPVLILWGKHDVALIEESAWQSLEYCDNGRLIVLENATHWVQHDEPERVNRHLIEYLRL